MGLEDKKYKPIYKKPQTQMGKNFDRKYTQQMRKEHIPHDYLKETDTLLNEKEQSIKKKIFNLSKMEALVHSDPVLSAVYNEMAEDGDEKYGYHYNETIMNLIFNEYVLNSGKYLQKYKMAIPKEKKRRDKSGIHQLQQAGKAEQKKQLPTTKKQLPQQKTESKLHNNSLPGTIEEDETSGNFAIVNGFGYDQERDGTRRNEKYYDTMKEPIKETTNNEFLKIETPIGSQDDQLFINVVNQGIDSHLEGFTKSKFNVNDTSIGKRRAFNFHKEEIPVLVRRLEEIGTDEAIQWAEDIKDEAYLEENLVKEHHLDTREDKIDFILSRQYDTNDSEWAYEKNELENYTDDNINNIYRQLEKQLGMYDVEETTGAASSGAFSAPLGHQRRQFAEGENKDEKKIEDNEIDETTTSTSSGAYETPRIWAGKGKKAKVKKEPAWKGGKIIGETNYLTDSIGFKKFINEMENDDPCWDDYKQYGMKTKDGKEVPNCVPESEEINEFEMSDTQVPTMAEDNMYSPDKLKNIDTETLGRYYVDLMNVVQKYQNVAKESGIKDDIESIKNVLEHRPDKSPEIENAIKEKGNWFKRLFGFGEGIDEQMPKITPQDKQTINALDQDLQKDGIDLRVNEKAKSKSQQQTAGAALSAKRKETDSSELRGASKEMYNSMTADELEDFAGTKHKNLPNKVEGIGATVGATVGAVGGAALTKSPMGSKIGGAIENKFDKNNLGEIKEGNEEEALAFAQKFQQLLDKLNKPFEQLTPKEKTNLFMLLGIGSEKEMGMGESIIDQPPFEDRDSTTMKLKQDSMEMTPSVSPIGGIGEQLDEKQQEVNVSNDNALRDFGKSKHGFGGRNKKKYIEGNKEPIEPKTMKKLTNEQVNEDVSTRTKCKRDEEPVPGVPINKPGGCRKKDSVYNKEEEKKNPHNIEARRKRLAKYEKELEAKKNEYQKELEKNKKEMDKQKKKSEVSEDKKPSSLVMKDRLGKENEQNFEQDFKNSNLENYIQMQDELKAKDQYDEVGDNPYEMGEKLEKEHLKNTDGKTLKNVGDSTNDQGDEIPKRNLTDDEQSDVNMLRKGQQDWVYDNEPSERFEERMKKDMGEEIYNQRKKKMEFQADAPMYNKDPQPVDDTKVKKDQFDKYKTGWNKRNGIGESMVTGKYRDEFGNVKFINFKLNETVEIEKPCEDCLKLNLEAVGNVFTSKVNENNEMRQIIDSFEFYMNGNKVSRVKTGKQTLTESNKKNENVISEQMEQMKKLMGYDPSKHMNTDGVKKNRNF